jgi:hypothetical protein
MSIFGNILTGAKPASGIEMIQPGKYLVAITDYKFLSNNEGWEGVNFEFTVQQGKYKGRKVWRTYTTAYPKDDKIASDGRNQLVGMLTAAGHPAPTSPDSAPIKSLRLGVQVRVSKNKKSGNEENSVVNWFEASKVPAEAPATSGLGAAPAPTALGGFGIVPPSTPAPSGEKLNDEIPF